MGQITNALIQHNLIPEDILNLPDRLSSIANNTLAGKWNWTMPNVNEQMLIESWSRKAEYFINNSWSEEDLAWLVKDNFTLHFITPHLITFDSLLRWDTYSRDELIRKEFNHLAKTISTLLEAADMIFVPDLSSVDFFDEDEDLTVDSYRKKANGNRLYAIEFE